jgi:hypothetical protein
MTLDGTGDPKIRSSCEKIRGRGEREREGGWLHEEKSSWLRSWSNLPCRGDRKRQRRSSWWRHEQSDCPEEGRGGGRGGDQRREEGAGNLQGNKQWADPKDPNAFNIHRELKEHLAEIGREASWHLSERVMEVNGDGIQVKSERSLSSQEEGDEVMEVLCRERATTKN